MTEDELLTHLDHCSRTGCKYGDLDCPVVSEESIIELSQPSYTFWPTEEPTKVKLEKALLKLPIKDGLVELYDVLKVVKQLFEKESNEEL